MTVSAESPAAAMPSSMAGSASAVFSVGCNKMRSPAFMPFKARSVMSAASRSRQSIVSRVHMTTVYPSSAHTLNIASPMLPDGGAKSFGTAASTAASPRPASVARSSLSVTTISERLRSSESDA